ncbi:putative Adenosine deaminase [Hypsibius exemplaris]|uniref:Adenosine deaminase n=1 Tax=Hypsibius exemplaris TaxID=2072580 RepID=A0A1W0W9B4_HYPEX|nr:putative Adenosine deaminase [Hypsibius exemplaris]
MHSVFASLLLFASLLVFVLEVLIPVPVASIIIRNKMSERISLPNYNQESGLAKWVALPKVELHCHLEGTLRFSTILQEAKRHKIQLPSNDEAELRKYFLVEEKVDSLAKFLQIVDRQLIIVQDFQTIVRMAREAVIDRCMDGIKVVELRYSPTGLQSAMKSSKIAVTLAEIHDAVQSGINEGAKLCQADGVPIYVGLLCTGILAKGQTDMNNTAEFLLANRGDFIGFDVAGAEEKLLDYKDIFDRVHEAGIKITIHAGELRTPQSVANIRDAIKSLHASRIGHGVNAIRDPEVYQLVKDSSTHLELCPISNVRTNAVDDIKTHPIKKYLDDSFNISISSDDPAAMDITLSYQYGVLHRTFNFGLPDFFRMNRDALSVSFIPMHLKKPLLEQYFSIEAERRFSAKHEESGQWAAA